MSAYKLEYAENADAEHWDMYVRAHPHASLYHLFGWRHVIHTTYGHKTYYLMLRACDRDANVSRHAGERQQLAGSIVGVVPLVYLKSAIFGNDLVSLPFFDSGGILANDGDAEQTLLTEAIRLGQELGAGKLELRQNRPLASRHEMNGIDNEGLPASIRLSESSKKVRMLLNLPDSSDALIRSFKSKLRNQITKPLREGLTSRSGGAELIDDFYKVFVVNMRHLGSPVHSVKLMQHVLSNFAERSRILVVYKSREPVASALVFGFNKILGNPWASSLRKYASLSPNMLLYMRMFEFACDNGYQIFDFGRSTPGEGTYKFKEQWGAAPAPLHWYTISLDGKPHDAESSGAERYAIASQAWRKLPLMVTKVLGPRIRKHISL